MTSTTQTLTFLGRGYCISSYCPLEQQTKIESRNKYEGKLLSKLDPVIADLYSITLDKVEGDDFIL